MTRFRVNGEEGRVAAALSTVALLFVSGCFGGKTDNGQTGSPFADPPAYQSGTRFLPDRPGGGTDPDGGEDSGTRPGYSRGEADDAGFSDGNLVLYVGDALQIFDVSSEETPVKLGRLSFSGYFRQLDVEDGMAWLVLHEPAQIDSDTIPDQTVPELQARLVAVDISDPTRPRRVASVDLDARFWSFERRGRSFYVIEELSPEVATTCEPQWNEGGPGTVGMRVRKYDFSGAAFEAIASQELPARTPYAYYSRDTLFVVDLSRANNTTRELSWIDFSDGNLSTQTGPSFERELNTVLRVGDSAFALDDLGRLTAIDLATGEKSEDVDAGAFALHLVTENLLAAVREDGEIALVDISDPAEPKWTASLAEPQVQLSTIVSTSEGVVTLGRRDDRTLSVILWDITAPDAPIQLANLAPSYEFPGRDESYFVFESDAWRRHTYDADTQTLLVPVLDGSISNTTGRLLSIAIQTGELEVIGDQVTHGQFFRPLEDNTFAFAATTAGLEKAPFLAPDSGNEPTAALLILAESEPLARIAIGEKEITLWERKSDGYFFIRSKDPDGETFELDLPHGAEHLLEVEGRAVAVSTRSDEECFEEGFAEQLPIGSLACAPFRNAGLSVIDVADGPVLVDSFEMPVVNGDKRYGDRESYFALADGRLVFPSSMRESCKGQAACAALGVEAHQSVSYGGCEMEGPDGEPGECTDETVSWSGSKSTLQLTVLSNVADTPSFEVAAEAPGNYWLDNYGTTTASDANVLFSETGFGFVRQEYLYDDVGEGLTNAQGDELSEFYLTRFSVLEDGSIQTEPPVSTPGVPLLWRHGQLLSVEPGYDKKGQLQATLHTSRIENDGAFIRKSQPVPGYYREVRRSGDFAYLLLAPLELCPAVFFVDILPASLSPAGAKLHAPTKLPFGGGYAGGEPAFVGDLLRVLGGPVPGASALYDVSEPDELHLVRYTTDLEGY